MSRTDLQAAHFIVHGRVQGVGFRYSASRRASRLGLSGYVRNRADGSVELWAEGGPEELRQLAAWLHQGPSMARVERVESTDMIPKGSYSRFRVTS